MGQLFDDDGRLKDPEALRSVHLGATRQAKVWTGEDGTKHKQLLRDDDGGVAAVTTEHSDGRVDAEVFARPATLSSGSSI